MADTLSVVIPNSAPAHNPTLEQEFAAQAAKAAGTPEASADRPQWLPQKFNSAEDLAKAYAELEKKLGAPKETATPEVTTPVTPAETTPAEEAAREASASAGLDFDALSAKYAETGSLEDADYAALAKQGISKELVDQFIAGQEASAAAVRNEVFSIVGGEQNYESMIAWAKTGLTAAEIAAYDKAVNSDSVDAVKFAVKGLKAQFEAVNGSEPNRVISGQVTPGSDVYDSIAQMSADMSDPRYKTDEAFRAKVQAKLGRSNIL